MEREENNIVRLREIPYLPLSYIVFVNLEMPRDESEVVGGGNTDTFSLSFWESVHFIFRPGILRNRVP